MGVEHPQRAFTANLSGMGLFLLGVFVFSLFFGRGVW
jgi:hypothetical protein